MGVRALLRAHAIEIADAGNSLAVGNPVASPVVKRVERLGDAVAPDGTVLTLFRHDGAYSIRVNGVELMSTRRHHSEEKLAELACQPFQHTNGAQVLIGGLGFGFTLGAALRTLGPDAHVVVVEIVDGVIEWNGNPEYPLAGAALNDERVMLRHDDVAKVLRQSRATFHAIILDVDNGADALTTAGNAHLYQSTGILAAVAALRPGGRLAYWSDRDDPAFEASLRDAGLDVEIVKARAHGTSGPWHTLYVGQRA